MEEQTLFTLVLLLIYYRATKRYKEKPVDGLWALIDQNFVEIIFAGILIPDTIGIAFKHLGKVI